jgi:GT2 family glycosyltransferase
LSGPLVVSAVIVSYNACAELRACLGSIARDQDTPIGEVIVVDNNSRDGSQEMVRTEFPSSTLMCNEDNVGFGAANNQAVAAAGGRYVLLLNCDTRVNAASVRELVAALEADQRLGLVGPRLLNADGSPQRSAFRFLTPANLALEQLSLARRLPAAGYLKGAALLGRADVLRRFGPFDPDYFMYCEDADLCYRLRCDGLGIRLVPQAAFTHVGGQSTKRHYEAMAVQAIASTYLFYRKHYGPMALSRAVAVVRGISALKWMRDAARLLWATAKKQPAEKDRWRREMLVWRRIRALRPPSQVAVD